MTWHHQHILRQSKYKFLLMKKTGNQDSNREVDRCIYQNKAENEDSSAVFRFGSCFKKLEIKILTVSLVDRLAQKKLEIKILMRFVWCFLLKKKLEIKISEVNEACFPVFQFFRKKIPKVVFFIWRVILREHWWHIHSCIQMTHELAPTTHSETK